MDSKLTLKLDKGVIDRAKAYAKSQETSLSKLIEHLLRAVATESDAPQIKIADQVNELTGVISIGKDDYKERYRKHLTGKYGEG